MNRIKEYFQESNPNITQNSELREPQLKAYEKIKNHFVCENSTEHSIVVIPTGVGKTGLIGIIPYGVSEGRVLIITPQLVIKDAVLDSLDPDYPGNFWFARKVFDNPSHLPVVIEYDSSAATKQWFKHSLNKANIVILNIHKLQKRLTSSLLNNVAEDFFDMIIIDEAHHSTADTWVEAVNYFKNAKVVKLTGTPFRSDDKEIVGKLIYKYKLSSAMAKGYVKSLEKFKYIPEELHLTLDEDESKMYTVEEIYNMKLKDEDWVSRSVAYSQDCSERVVIASLEKLEEKLNNNPSVPHKIIAVACSIPHANQIRKLYESNGYPCAIVHSKMTQDEKESNLKDIENHRVKVVINVAMLGEGYDHPYLSIAAIFRPFRHALPYAQFIGRILRIIPLETSMPADNIGQVVSHEFLYLDKLWEYYKEQIQESEVIKYIEEQEDIIGYEEGNNGDSRSYDTSVGRASESGQGRIELDTYLQTDIIKQRNEALRREKEEVLKMKEMFNISEQKARELYKQIISDEADIKRPDLYFKVKSKEIDDRIKLEIVPELIVKYGIIKEAIDLGSSRLFNNKKYKWIVDGKRDNAAMLAVYMINLLNEAIGKKKDQWIHSDLPIAERKLEEIQEFVEGILAAYTSDVI